ncbi:putative glycosyltransferase EpsE [compost metagenome]
MAPNKPKVSVLVLCYNQEDTIGQTLESLIGQKTDFNIEILIGDDSSSDQTRAICLSYAEAYPSIVSLHPVTPNVGLLENYKRLVLLAKGNYVSCCAGDDYWIDPFKLQKQADFLDTHPDYGMVHSNYTILFDETGKTEVVEKKVPEGTVLGQLLSGNFVAALTAMYRTIYVQEAINEGILSSDFPMEDYPVWLYISERSKIGFLSENTAVWRKMEESVSNTKNLSRQLRFHWATIEVKILFAKRNGYDAIIPQLIDSLRSSLFYAAINKQSDVALQISRRIQDIDHLSVKDHLILAASKYRLLRQVLKIWMSRGSRN